MKWTDELIARAAAMWNDGKTSRQIGEALGCSRNAVVSIAHRKPDLFIAKANSRPGRPARQRSTEDNAGEGLRRRIVNRGRDAAKREKAVEMAQALRKGKAPPLQAKLPPDIGLDALFEVDQSLRMRGDLSRMALKDHPAVAFVDLKAGQCKLTLIGFSDVAGPFSPCCGAATGDVTKPWCPAHRQMLRAA